MGMNGTAWAKLVSQIPDEGYFQKEQEAGRKAEAEATKQALIEDRLAKFLKGGMGPGTEKRSFNPESGAIGGSEDNLMKFLQMQNAADARLDKGVENLSKRQATAGIPDAIAPMQALESQSKLLSTPPDQVKTKNIPGRWTNMAARVPVIGGDIADMMSRQYGGEDIRQNAQSIYNTLIKAQQGGTVTGQEEARKMLELGLRGDERSLVKGIQMANDVLKLKDQSIRAGYGSDVRQRYSEQGGPDYSSAVTSDAVNQGRNNAPGGIPGYGPVKGGRFGTAPQDQGGNFGAKRDRYNQLRAKYKGR